ncbi:MAG TPA: class I adenylate-forming enzyme family protein [Acidimicrobiia bacterium]|nr:class I adenylate-forming enzyme family protein [Acidimicrobiia bacterium]
MTTVGVPEDVARVEATLLADGGPFELVDVDVEGVTIRCFKNRIRTLRDLLLKSVGFGDAVYMLATDGTTERRLSYAEHARSVASVAAAFRDRYDVQPGDRVAILGANCPEWVIAFWAAISLGAVAVGLNGWSTGPEIKYFLDDCEPKVLVADRRRVERLAGDDPGVALVVMEDDFSHLEAYAPDAPFADVEVGEDDAAIILYTSGTTGRPKGAINTHRNLASYLMLNFYNGAKAMMLAPPPGPDDPPVLPTCQLVSSPLFHVSGLHSAAVMMLATGTKSVWLMGRFDPAVAMRIIERERCTGWSFTETVLHRMVNHPDVGRYDLSSIRTVGGGGSPVAPSLIERTRRVFPNASHSVGIGYGQTECAALATLNNGQELIDFPMSVGRPLPTVELEIRDPGGEALPEGEEGEVCVRGPMVMPGYWRRPDATAETITADRWLHTGDIGRMEGGRLYLSSRKRDLIFRGGENVYPVEIEKRIEDHPDVEECAVIGVDHPELGQTVKAVLVARPGHTIDLESVRAWCAAELSYYKVPEHWELREGSLPRNAAGKILKDALRDTRADTGFVEE